MPSLRLILETALGESGYEVCFSLAHLLGLDVLMCRFGSRYVAPGFAVRGRDAT